MFYEQFLLFSVLQSKNVYKNEALLYLQLMEWYIFSRCSLELNWSSTEAKFDPSSVNIIVVSMILKKLNVKQPTCMLKLSKYNSYVIQRIRITLDEIPTNDH